MRVRAVVVLFLIVLGFVSGCRGALSPNVDRDRPPETWLTAAPQDTVTLHNSDRSITIPVIHTIPIRFHMYWAGSDQDGAVVGFYWAVVETLPQPVPGTFFIPPLPSPRTSQYRFTTRTDSTFTFNVSEFAPDRQHAFFIYAVDDKGKGDPTPARFIFNALDRFPPLPLFDVAQSTGRIARVLTHGTYALKDTTIALRDTFDVTNRQRAPTDTLPSHARIDFRWHAEPQIVGGYAVKYKYQLGGEFVEVDSSTHVKSYNTGLVSDAIPAGTWQFTLRAIDAAGGARDVNRRFQVNFDPETWFAGPDSNLVPRAANDQLGHRWKTINSKADLLSGGGSLLSCDSLWYWPSERPQRKTFWEVYKDKLYLHAENDTVNMNSFVIIQPGGRDIDSPYNVQYSENDAPVHDGIPDTVLCSGQQARALRPGGPNGSPIGFRYQVTVVASTRNHDVANPSPTALFPVFDATSPFVVPQINGYGVFNASGKIYLVLRAVDGDGEADNRLLDQFQARLLADRVDAGGGTANEIALRRQAVLTFYVNHAPYFDFNAASFFPRPQPGGVPTPSPTRVLGLNLPAIDPDPYDPATKPAGGGQPSTGTVLRTQVTVTGTYTLGGVTRDTTYAAPAQFTTAYTIDLDSDAPYITGTHLSLAIELCDCSACEEVPGSGLCVNYTIPVDVPPPTADALGGNTSRPTGTTHHLSSSRSQTP